MTKKSAAELEAERAAAQEQLEAILSTSRPKNLAEGVSSGVGNIVAGAVGAAGIAVLAPTLGLAVGLRGGGIIGGVVGVAGGAVVGILGAAAVAVGGALSGLAQIGRGIAAVPQSIAAPRQGKWWNERLGKWVLTDMNEEKVWIASFSNEEDADILGKVQQDLDASATAAGSGEVVDTFYYECLEVTSNAETGVIKRQYYLLARKYHPDKNPGDTEAAEKFKNIAEAYQVLSDKELRAKYDKEGKDGLSADKTSVAETMAGKLDPTLLFAFLFGSDKFSNYVGRLSTATAASVGDSPKISIQDASELQKRRVTRLAVHLIDKISPWVHAPADVPDARSAIEAEWTVEGDTLAKASFGHQLVTTIGKCYNLMAIIYEGSLDSGQGLPSISKWAAKSRAELDTKHDAQKGKLEQLRAGLDMMKIQAEISEQMAKAKTDEEKEALNQKLMNASLDVMLRVLWTTTVVDITATIQETTQMVFFDTSVDAAVQKERVAAVKTLGSIWMNMAESVPEKDAAVKDARQLYEEAAFAAMLETVKRQDEAAHASVSKA